MSGSYLEDVACRECDAEAIAMDVKEEPTLYKIGAMCGDCEYDYGVIDRVSRRTVTDMDAVYDWGEDSIRELLD